MDHIKNCLKPGLYIVSTPIGNLEDITFRAVNILKSADIILCEDTRITAKLLEHFSIKAKLIVYNDHSDDFLRKQICSFLDEEQVLALVSDAGTPLISDPGYKLVSKLQSEGYHIDIAPGASSVVAALTLSGLPTDRFAFLGFLPRTENAKKAIFQEVANVKSTAIFFETAERVVDSLEIAYEILGDREAAIVREITKLFQEAKRATLSELIIYYKEHKPRGEIVFLISGVRSDQEFLSDNEVRDMLEELLKNHSTKDATEILFAQIESRTRLKKKEIYRMCL
jgi:16S rRNA (cytidine1402-2'-O)-methyltransferase